MAFSQNIHPVLFHHDCFQRFEIIFFLSPFQRHPFQMLVTLQKIKSYEYLCVILKKSHEKPLIWNMRRTTNSFRDSKSQSRFWIVVEYPWQKCVIKKA
jgi:hypothetical protein